MTPRELFQSDDLSWLQRPDAEVESASVERKRWADKDKVAKQFSGFANGGPDGGLLVLGVEKTGEIAGVDGRAADRLIAELPGCIDACRLEHRTVQFNDRTVLMFFVPSSPKKVICTSDGHAYQRRGNTTVELSDAEIRELRFSRGEESFEDFPAAPWSPELVDRGLLDSYLEARRLKNGLTLDLSTEEALRTRNLLVDTSRGLMLTNAGLLAFGKNPLAQLPGARLRLLRFDGVVEKFGAERNVTKDRWFEGPIPHIVAGTREFIRTLVREFDYLGPNGLFVNEPEYPEFAWDEAIVNALVHRSYSLANATVFVRIFDDRMEIQSPGSFPGPRRELQSYPRNPHLMDTLQYLELVRLAREGTRRMSTEMQKFGLPPPEFSEPNGVGVLVVLRNDLERRRQRQASPDLRAKWDEVTKLIEEPLALYRKRGLEQWEALVQSGASPSGDALSAAARVLMDHRIDPNQRTQFVDPLRRSVAGIPKRELNALVSTFTEGSFAAASGLEGLVIVLLRESHDARAQLLRWLESCPPATGDIEGKPTKQIGHALWALHADLTSQRPFPAREYIDRVLAVAQKHAVAPAAQRLYEDITGRPLK